MNFPKGFLWGAATSAYQVEGGIDNNDWARVQAMPKPGLACDHYHRFAEDFSIAKKLHHNAHRLSLEWSRIEPEEGRWDEAELRHYHEVLEFLKQNGMMTFVTVHHFTNPIWVARQGGWANKKTIKDFEKFVAKISQSIGYLIDFWVTINEPNIYANLGYMSGVWPPFNKNIIKAYLVYRNMLEAHDKAFEIIHNYYPKAQVGFAQNFSWRRAEEESYLEKLFIKFINWLTYDFPYRRTRNDFIGVNHYTDIHLKLSLWSKNPIAFRKHPGPASERGWAIHPHAIFQVLNKLKNLKIPIYITENGLADAKDEKRGDYIRGYLSEINRAIRDGVDVRGYMHWSLMDNFEWEDGYKWKFGLVEVDFKTQKRTIRESARVYAEICKNNAV